MRTRRDDRGRKSLDDFCASFLGQNDNGTVWVRPYEAADVYRELAAHRQALPSWASLFALGL